MDASRGARVAARRRLAQLLAQQREDALGVAVRSGSPFGSCTVTTEFGGASATLIRYCSGRSFSSVFQNMQLRRASPQSRAFAASRIRIGIADEVDAAAAVAVDHGEAGAVEREPDAAPRAVERVVDRRAAYAPSAPFSMRAASAGVGWPTAGGAFAATALAATGAGVPKRIHEPREHLRLERPDWAASPPTRSATGDELSILVVGTCSMPRCEM